jgi:hypothetical protein
VDPATSAYLSGQDSGPRGGVRETLTDPTEKFSGARLERVVLDDGRRFVVKHLSSGGDWLTRATGGVSRMMVLWECGLLDEISVAVDHTVIDCVDVADGLAVIMRDASAELIPSQVPVLRSTSSRLLRGLARLHQVSVGDPVEGLCSVASRYQMFAPLFHRQDSGQGVHPLRDIILNGWDAFFELVPADVAAAVTEVHEDPIPLGRALEQFPHVLLHGDAKLENLGLGAEKPVLIDWGDLTGFGPVEVDAGWYVLKGGARIAAELGDLFADYEAASGRTLNPRALDLVCLGTLAQMGFRMANSARHGRPETRAIGADHLDWWVRRVRPVLDALPY